MAKKMFVDLERCIGCWTCSMACKMCHNLADDEYRVTVRTNGSGAGIDRPQGVYPNLRMSWQPIYQKSCTFCPERQLEGLQPMCVHDCPTEALAYGDESDPESAFSVAKARCVDSQYHLFTLPDYENTKSGIVYATRA